MQFVELLVWNNWRLPAFISRSILHFHSGEDERTLSVILSPDDGETEASIYYFKSLGFFLLFFYLPFGIMSHELRTRWVECG